MTTPKKYLVLGLLSVLAFFSLPVTSGWAASCPYCNKYYPPPAPGDESRVYALRRQHERVCPYKPGPIKQGPNQPQQKDDYGVVTIHNRTGEDRTYSLQSRSGGSWARHTVKAGGSYGHWILLPAAFRIRFDSSFASGYQSRTYKLDYNVVKKRKPTPQDGRPYHFKVSGQNIQFFTGSGKAATTTRTYNNPLPIVPPVNDVWRRQQELDRLARERADQLKRMRASELARKGDRFASEENYSEAIEAYQDSLNEWRVADVQTRLNRARSQLVEQRRRKEEAEQQARNKVSGIVSNLAGRFSGNSGAGGGLDFDGTSSGADGGRLDSPSAEKPAAGQLEFERGSQGSAPVPVEVLDFDFDSQSSDLDFAIGEKSDGGSDLESLYNKLYNEYLKEMLTLPDSSDDMLADLAEMQKPTVEDLPGFVFRKKPAARSVPRDGPPTEHPDRALPNPLDGRRIRRERMWLDPLNPLNIHLRVLDEAHAIDYADARVVANRNEAARLSRTELEEAWNKLRRQGQLGADENPQKKSENDTAFKAKFDAVLREVTEKQNKRMRLAEQGWERDMVRWRKWQAKKSELEPRIEKTEVKLAAEWKAAFNSSRSRFEMRCEDIAMGLRAEGVLNEGESASAKARRDPAFAARWKAETAKATVRLTDELERIEEDRWRKYANEIKSLEREAGIAD